MNETHKESLKALVKRWWEQAEQGDGPLGQQFITKYNENMVKAKFQADQGLLGKNPDENIIKAKAKAMTKAELANKQEAFIKAVTERESGLPLSMDTRRLLGDNVMGNMGNQFAAMGQDALSGTLSSIPIFGGFLSKMIPLLIKAVTVAVESFQEKPPGADGKKKGYFERFGEQWTINGERTALREVITALAPTANVDNTIKEVIEGVKSPATDSVKPAGASIGYLSNPLPGGPPPLPGEQRAPART